MRCVRVCFIFVFKMEIENIYQKSHIIKRYNPIRHTCRCDGLTFNYFLVMRKGHINWMENGVFLRRYERRMQSHQKIVIGGNKAEKKKKSEMKK